MRDKIVVVGVGVFVVVVVYVVFVEHKIGKFFPLVLLA